MSRARRCAAAVLVLAVWSTLPAGGEVPPPEMVAPSPLRLPALEAIRAAAELLAGEDVGPEQADRARALLEDAIASEPRLPSAWVNLSAAAIRACDREHAMFAALVAASLDPDERSAVANLRLARRLDCGPAAAAEPDARAAARRGVLERPGAPEPWMACAAAARADGARLLSVLYETFALQRGAAREATLLRAVDDLEQEGMWRHAAALLARLEGAGDGALSTRRARILERVDAQRPAAEALAAAIATRVGLVDGDERAGVIALAEMLLARGESPTAAERTLLDWLEGSGERRYAGPYGTLVADRDWVSVDEPGRSDAWPDLVLRRFPGDTQVALFTWPADAPDDERATEAIAGRLSAQGATGEDAWTACGAPAGQWCRGAPFAIDLGSEGRGSVTVHLLGVDGSGPRAAAVALAGDAGCGSACAADARRAIDALLGGWSPAGGGERAARDGWHVPVPRAWQSPEIHDEGQLPWRSFPIGDALRIDVPPGLVVGLVRGAFRPAGAPEGTRLWMRGEYVDREGRRVRVGSREHAGLVVVSDEPPGEAPSPPTTDRAARAAATADISGALERAGVGSAGLVTRFDGGAFAGTWLVAQSVPSTAAATGHVRIELPVAEGVRSLSLLWMPLTVRALETEGPPPPVDTSGRFEIRFQPLPAERSRVDPRGGTLFAEQLRLSVPRDFRVSLNSASRDGFPVSLRAATGTEIRIERWPPATVAPRERLAQAASYEGGPPADGWSEGSKTRGGTAFSATWPARPPASEGGAGAAERFVVVVVPEAPERRPAYRLRVERGAAVEDDDWRLVRAIVADSAGYRSRKAP